LLSEPAQPWTPLASLHTHSHYCDGHGEILDYVEAAIQNGLAAYGASGHAPLPFPCPYAIPLNSLETYRADVRNQQDRNNGRIPIYLGLELDYLPGLADFYANEFFGPGLDYAVASVHFVGEPGAIPWVYDESADAFATEVQRRHRGDVRPMFEDYFRRIQLLATESREWNIPIIIGHLDRVSIWNRDNRWFDPEAAWYVQAVDDALDVIAQSGRILEINTSGWNKQAVMCNPSPSILARAVTRGIPIIVSADAHYPQNVAQHYQRAVQVLRDVGCHSIVVPSSEAWRSVPLPS
jgi:histidinol-phosphatase (PHP family)